MKLVVPQRLLGPRMFLACALMVELLIIMAIDMYVPALPSMQCEFGVTAAYLNLTMFAFFAVGAVGVVLAGPMSDRLGRKPVVVAGCVLFTASSLGCALAPNVEALVFFRMIEALGYGAVTTLATALVKDAFTGADLKTAMTCLQSFILIGPAVAPFLGTFVLSHTDWRGIFVVLTFFGVGALACALLMTETLPRTARSGCESVGAALATTWRGVRILVREKGFLPMVLILGVVSVPYFAFIAVISYVLLDHYAVGYGEYNVLYLIFCLVNIVAPYVYAFASKRMHGSTVLKGSIAAIGVTGVLLWCFGPAGPIAFLVAFMPATLAEGIIRPLSYVVLLDQPNDRVGAASSFSHFSYNVFTAVATVIATLPWWPNYIVGLAVITIVSTLAMVVAYGVGLRGRKLDGGHHDTAQ